MALLMRHVNAEPESLSEVRPGLPRGVVDWVGAMLAKDPGARPAGAAPAWDRLEDVLCDSLGARWRREAALPEPGAAPEPVADIDPDPPSEIGFVAVVAPPVRPTPPAPDPEPPSLVLEPPAAQAPRAADPRPRASRRGPRAASGPRPRGT